MPSQLHAVIATSLLLLATNAHATGPSSVTVRLQAVAVNSRGEALLRTWREANPDGAHVPGAVDLGWLVVSARGTWRESTHRVNCPHAEAERWFERAIDLASPPASLRDLVAAFRFTTADSVKPDEGAGVVNWSADHACIGKHCTPAPVAQRTVGGIPSASAVAQPTCVFYKAGIAILRNTVNGDGLQRGARFDLPGSLVVADTRLGLQESGFSIASIDAVALVSGIEDPARSRLP
ncbi:MAG: hypothetical protein QM765_34970 [Myxococcales bacterium]